jgi:alkylhydroperoxidase family enzyme
VNADEVRRLAPEAVAAWDAVYAAVPTTVPDDPSCREFAEQFGMDVAATTEEQRRALSEALGRATFGFVQTVYVADQGSRTRAALRQLFDADPIQATPAGAGELWPAIEAMMAAVQRLDRLDELTSELVRLRGANAHNCRVCRSRRHAPVVAAHGLTPLDQVDRYETSELAPEHKAALRLTDAILWSPDVIPRAVISDVHDHFTPQQATEIVLDVTRNATNKIAVALAADQPNVSDGVELFDVSPDGAYSYWSASV